MRCIIIDDEPIARRGLKRLLGKYKTLELLETFGSAKEALSYVEKNEVDLVFLDIKMDGISGMELAHLINGKVLVIFITAFPQYAIESYEVNAIDYLMKPINRERLDKAVEKALNYHNLIKNGGTPPNEIKAGIDCLIVKSERKYLRIQIFEIKYIEGLKDYVIIHLDNNKVITHLTLKTVLGMLPDTLFIRVSKSYAVNRNKVKAFDNNDVFIDEEVIPIGPAYRESVLANLLG